MPKDSTTIDFDLDALAASEGTGPVFGQETEDLDLTYRGC